MIANAKIAIPARRLLTDLLSLCGSCFSVIG
jgi:hypothetical protein